MDFFQAFHYLKEHPAFKEYFVESLDIAVVKVDPKTKRIEDEQSRNTETAVWLETGPVYEGKHREPIYTHDPDIDCGGSTFEEAIIRLAKNVARYYDHEV